jgi:histidinol-phosphate aminotransferase
MLANRLKTLNPYKPGEQLNDREYIKLNANENPFSPPKEVAEAVSNLLNTNIKSLSLYPDPDSTDLRIEIAKFLNKTGGVLANIQDAKNKLNFEITPEMIFCGNGSDEVLSFVFYAFFDKLIIPEHTYSFYPVYCDFYNIDLEKIPLNKDFSINKEMMLEKAKFASGMIFANPNAPTSLALSNDEIRTMLKNYPKDKVFVVDLDSDYNDYFSNGKLFDQIGNTGWHLTSLGYLYASRVIEIALSKVIADNYGEFQDVFLLPYGSTESLD